MATVKYDHIAIQDGARLVAHVFVAPHDVHGVDIGYDAPTRPGKGRRRIAGELFIGNQQDGYYTIDFEAILTKAGDGTLEFLGTPYDLRAGRCFVVTPRGVLSQLACQTKDEALTLLPK